MNALFVNGLLTLDITSLNQRTLISKTIKKESTLILRNYRIETTTTTETVALLSMGLEEDEQLPLIINGAVTVESPDYVLNLKNDVVSVFETFLTCPNFLRLTLQFEVIG